ncbi:MAG: hypothetical protein R2685_10250 [Candidatus Nitrosocosmicus sp.]|jgi:hypothetical protein|nr:hypothetical protein [Candidatus Nitrosocosmicus sp.]
MKKLFQNVDKERKNVALAILRKLYSENQVQTPWVERTTLRASMAAMIKGFDDMLNFLLQNKLIDHKIGTDKFSITKLGIDKLNIEDKISK